MVIKAIYPARGLMLKLAKAYQNYDPVNPSILEVILCYPGYRAVKIHRISHKLYKLNLI